MGLKMMAIMVGICEHEGIPYEPETDLKVLMRLTRGHVSPLAVCGVYLYPKHPGMKTFCSNYREIIKFMDEKGLWKC